MHLFVLCVSGVAANYNFQFLYALVSRKLTVELIVRQLFKCDVMLIELPITATPTELLCIAITAISASAEDCGKVRICGPTIG